MLDPPANAMLQVFRDAKPQAVLTFAMPFQSDSCGCIMSHLLDVPLLFVDGNPLVRGPLSVPQVPGWCATIVTYVALQHDWCLALFVAFVAFIA
jgi:hypothetical protein